MSLTVFTCLLFVTSTQAQSCQNVCENGGTVTGKPTASNCGCYCAAGFFGPTCAATTQSSRYRSATRDPTDVKTNCVEYVENGKPWEAITTAEECFAAVVTLFPQPADDPTIASDYDLGFQGCITSGYDPGIMSYFSAASSSDGNGCGVHDRWKCICKSQGEACEIYCRNGGVAKGTPEANDCTCSCPADFSGQFCEICTGADCPCKGSWTECDANCERTFSITTPKTGNGPCNLIDSVKECCSGGSCPNQLCHSACQNICENGGRVTRSPIDNSCGCYCAAGFFGPTCASTTQTELYKSKVGTGSGGKRCDSYPPTGSEKWAPITSKEECLLAITKLYPEKIMPSVYGGYPRTGSYAQYDGCTTSKTDPGTDAFFRTVTTSYNGNGCDYKTCVCKFGNACDNVCHNDGTVTGTKEGGDCTCSCPAGFSGQYCEICTGANCPCIGDWTTCDANCQRTFNILTPKTGTGFACNSIDGEKECCIGGNCPNEWKFTTKSFDLTLTASAGVPVFQETGDAAATAICNATYTTETDCNASSACMWVLPAADANATCTSGILNSEGTGCDSICSSGKINDAGNGCERKCSGARYIDLEFLFSFFFFLFSFFFFFLC